MQSTAKKAVLAANKGDFGALQNWITKRGVNFKCKDGKTALHHAAAEKGNLGLVKHLVDEQGANVSEEDKWGNTPLAEAAAAGNLDALKHLVAAYVAASGVTHEKESALGTSLMVPAAMGGNLEVVNYLVYNLKADPCIMTESGTLGFAAPNSVAIFMMTMAIGRSKISFQGNQKLTRKIIKRFKSVDRCEF